MDDLVKQAMKKWPDVPDCYGWLGLDARGDWYMRDSQVQALGIFPENKGSRLTHDRLIAFINRNYACDMYQRWYFQNGPQRVYVELEITPWIWRVKIDGTIQSHTGATGQVKCCIVDEYGHLYLGAEEGLGLVHTQDVLQAAEFIESGLWIPEEVLMHELPKRFGYIRSPQRLAETRKH